VALKSTAKERTISAQTGGFTLDVRNQRHFPFPLLRDAQGGRKQTQSGSLISSRTLDICKPALHLARCTNTKNNYNRACSHVFACVRVFAHVFARVRMCSHALGAPRGHRGGHWLMRPHVPSINIYIYIYIYIIIYIKKKYTYQHKYTYTYTCTRKTYKHIQTSTNTYNNVQKTN
jgi:hypothetical protein